MNNLVALVGLAIWKDGKFKSEAQMKRMIKHAADTKKGYVITHAFTQNHKELIVKVVFTSNGVRSVEVESTECGTVHLVWDMFGNEHMNSLVSDIANLDKAVMQQYAMYRMWEFDEKFEERESKFIESANALYNYFNSKYSVAIQVIDDRCFEETKASIAILAETLKVEKEINMSEDARLKEHAINVARKKKELAEEELAELLSDASVNFPDVNMSLDDALEHFQNETVSTQVDYKKANSKLQNHEGLIKIRKDCDVFLEIREYQTALPEYHEAQRCKEVYEANRKMVLTVKALISKVGKVVDNV